MSEIAFSTAGRLGPHRSAKFFILLGLLGSRLDHRFWSAGVNSQARVDQFPLFATKCYQTASEELRKLLKMVDLVGIEPTTSSMPWNYKGGRPLILKQLLAGQAGKTGINSAICYQIATKLNKWDRRADSWGISPSGWTTIGVAMPTSLGLLPLKNTWLDGTRTRGLGLK